MQNSNYKTLVEFASEVERREETKNDYMASSGKLLMLEDKALAIEGVGSFEVNDYAHGQLANRLSIPKKYYDEMEAVSGLRSHNVNAWLNHNPEEKRFVRTLDGKARAILSDGFKPIDNFDLLKNSIFPAIEPFKNELSIQAHTLSDTRMYLQIVFRALQAEVKKGDLVAYGITLRNSEVGAGAVAVEDLIWRYTCSNGMIGQSLFKKYHVGKRASDEDMGGNFWAQDTIKKELEAYQLRLRDVIKHALTDGEFLKKVSKLQEADEDRIDNIVGVVENVTKRFNLSEKDGAKMIQNMSSEGNLSRYGLANSLTFLAHGFENADKQYDMETLGAQIIDLSPKDWKIITTVKEEAA